MESGKIYKYTNLINGMVYIGQTRQTLEQRDYKHQTQLNDNTYFHRAIKKYGRENFSLELVEDNIPLNELDEKEKYYIDYFESFYTTGKGYNLTQGGQWGSGTQKLTIAQANEVKWLLANTDRPFQSIGADYNVTLYCISDINRGKSFVDESIDYPIRKIPSRSYIDEVKINIILDMLLNTNMTQEEIGLATDVNAYTVGDISRGVSWKNITQQFKCPIRKNKLENQKIYESIYGIV